MRYEIWTFNPKTGAMGRRVARYGNRGHAIAKLRGLRRAARRLEVVQREEWQPMDRVEYVVIRVGIAKLEYSYARVALPKSQAYYSRQYFAHDFAVR